MNKSSTRMIVVLIIVFFAYFTLMSFLTKSQEPISFDGFIEMINTDKVKTINTKQQGTTYEVYGQLNEQNKTYHLLIPDNNEFVNTVQDAAENKGIIIEYKATTNNGQIFSSIITISMLILTIIIFRSFSKSMGGDNPNSPGNMNAKQVNDITLKFSDVIGYEEEKQELVEIIDYLKDPQKYHDVGAKVPKGVLLEGPPGTGKTLMAKAIAGEANIPFFPISGSDFIEMYAGVGASRVRSLFEQAKKHDRAIIFVDEIDAIGSREKSSMGKHSEQEQTINQMLTELDGFHSKDRSVLIIAATNRADKLDAALTRPGRFDRKILIGLPSLKDRENILIYHGSKRQLDDDVNFEEISKLTMAMSGADLQNVVNEAAILAVRDLREKVSQDDIIEAIDRVLMGPAKVSNKYSERDIKLVSYHETGHAIIGLHLEGAMQVEKITIIPRKNAAGYVSYSPDEERGKFMSKQDLLNEVVGLLGGRASEELFFKDLSTGAHNDLQRATKIVRAMITEYSMTEITSIQLESRNYKEGRAHKSFSEKTNILIDDKINELLNECYKQACDILKLREKDVHLLANEIQKKETMTRIEINNLLESNQNN